MYRSMLGQGLLNGKTRLVAIIALALALLIPTTMTASANGGPTPANDFCVEGLVIDWQEEPIEEGWLIVATALDLQGNPIGPTVEASPSDDDDEKGQFEFSEDNENPLVVNGNPHPNWQFEIVIDPAVLIGDWRPVEPYSSTQVVEFDYGQDGCERLRFKLKEVIAVGVLKIDADHNGLEGWKIIATPGKDNLFAYEQDVTTGPDGQGEGGDVLELTPGEWIFTEEPPEDEDTMFKPVIPKTGRQVLVLESAEDRAEDDIEGNEFDASVVDYVVRFKNELDLAGCIDVYKYDVPPSNGDGPTQAEFGLAGWEISVLRADGSEERFGYTDAMGRIKFEHLPFGPYTVREETRTGWDAVSPDAYDVHLTPDDEGCIVVRFDNIQAPPVFVIEGYKLDANGHYGIPNWEIKAEPLSKNGFDPENEFTDGTGYYRFELPADDYRVPGSKYEICEDDELDGWLPHTPTCYTVTLPDKPGTVKVPDFVNQQVGHTESQKPSGGWSGGMSSGWSGGSMGGGMMGGSMGGGMMGGMEMKCSKYHKVEKGEGLYEIGAMYMVPAGAMLAANSWIQDRPHHYLYPGDKVCIP